MSISKQERLRARYEQLCVIIERAQGRFEKYDKLARRAMKQLMDLERERRRKQKVLARVEAEAANALVADSLKSPDVCERAESGKRPESTPATPPERPGEATPGELASGTDSLPAPEAARARKNRLARERRAKTKAATNGHASSEAAPAAGSPGPALLSAMFPIGGRQARMEAAGFRKVTKRT